MRGQAFSMDIIAASAVFFFMMLTIFYFQALFTGKIALAEGYAEREAKAEVIADAVYLGLTKSAVFSLNATQALFSQGYAQLDDAYRIYYNYTIQVQDTRGSVRSIGNLSLQVGTNPQAQNVMISAHRIGVLNGTIARLVVTVW